MQNELIAARAQLRDNLARQEFGMPYEKLDEDRKGAVDDFFKVPISEAEPKRIGGEKLMARFVKTGKKSVSAISTSSLPDIVFMILFFMAVTTMRETDVMVTVRIPEATEGKVLEKKSLASFIYIGEPLEGSTVALRRRTKDPAQ